MAYIVKSMSYSSPLARAPFDRQRDVYKLARKGSGDCRRLWNDFAAEVPHMARLVISDVESEMQETASITKSLDRRLAKAEKSVRPKLRKSAKLTKAQREYFEAEVLDPGMQKAEFMRSLLESPDPFVREGAKKALGR